MHFVRHPSIFCSALNRWSNQIACYTQAFFSAMYYFKNALTNISFGLEKKMGSYPRAGNVDVNIYLEIFLRVLLFFIFLKTQYMEPFHRKIHPEELWLYKNPRTTSFVPSWMLWPFVTVTPLSIICGICSIRKDKIDAYQAVLGLSLTLGLNGVITNIIKLITGRPRPDFFWRCFPNGDFNLQMNCTGNMDEITEGLKSFPSGHSSFCFASMGFISLYLAGKLGCFNNHGRGKTLQLCFTILPLLLALMISLSRTADYHHHWQDVLVGSVLGFIISYIGYHQYYPPLHSPQSDTCNLVLQSHAYLPKDVEKQSFSQNRIPIKWI